MNNFLLSTCDEVRTIAEMKISNGYSFNPKNQTGTFQKVKSVSIYDPKRIENVIITKYSIKYRRLAKIIKDILDSEDATDSDYVICLDEIEKLKSILAIKYQAFLENQMYEYFLNDLYFLESIMHERLIERRNSAIMGGR